MSIHVSKGRGLRFPKRSGKDRDPTPVRTLRVADLTPAERAKYALEPIATAKSRRPPTSLAHSAYPGRASTRTSSEPGAKADPR